MLWVFVAPAVILVGVLMYYPMIGTVLESLYSTSFISPKPQFAGLSPTPGSSPRPSSRRWCGTPACGPSCVVVLQNVVGFAIALLLNQGLPGQGLMRSLVLLPWILPGVVTAILWRFMYDPQLGLINSFLVQLGLAQGGIPLLAEASTAMAAAIVAAVWKGFPFSTLVYLAALQTVDPSRSRPPPSTGPGGCAGSSTSCCRPCGRWWRST